MKLKNLKNTFFLIIFSTTVFFCQEKPVKQIYPGISDDELKLMLAGLITNTGSSDNRDGTVIDNNSGLIWRKCTQGQIYRTRENDCQGVETNSTTNPFISNGNDRIRWGATQISYCSTASNSCNKTTVPQELVGNTAQAFSGETSAAFLSCRALNDASGLPGWRVPNPYELQLLTNGGRNAMLLLFPQTQEEFYWSTWSRAEDVNGQTAAAVSFEQVRFGEIENRIKTDRYYVRCVRNK